MPKKSFFESAPWELRTREGQVVIDDLVCVSSNNGIVLWNWQNFTHFIDIPRWREVATILAEYHHIEPTRLIDAIEKAITCQDHELLPFALTGGWPDGTRGPISFERFLEVVRLYENRAATRTAKRKFSEIRRRDFQANRSALILKMLDSGIAYCCAHPGCSVSVNLTVDHKVALSRGGTDEISNLQFMCIAHNSAKGDRDP